MLRRSGIALVLFTVLSCAFAGESDGQSAVGAALRSADRSNVGRPSASAADSHRLKIDLRSMIQAALADAARRTGRVAAALKVVSAEAVIWPDGSLGCAEPGVMYTMAPVRGYQIYIEVADSVLDYHASERGQLVLCPAGQAGLPSPDSSK